MQFVEVSDSRPVFFANMQRSGMQAGQYGNSVLNCILMQTDKCKYKCKYEYKYKCKYRYKYTYKIFHQECRPVSVEFYTEMHADAFTWSNALLQAAYLFLWCYIFQEQVAATFEYKCLSSCGGPSKFWFRKKPSQSTDWINYAFKRGKISKVCLLFATFSGIWRTLFLMRIGQLAWNI